MFWRSHISVPDTCTPGDFQGFWVTCLKGLFNDGRDRLNKPLEIAECFITALLPFLATETQETLRRVFALLVRDNLQLLNIQIVGLSSLSLCMILNIVSFENAYEAVNA